jgi:hypothetical protein
LPLIASLSAFCTAIFGFLSVNWALTAKKYIYFLSKWVRSTKRPELDAVNASISKKTNELQEIDVENTARRQQ